MPLLLLPRSATGIIQTLPTVTETDSAQRLGLPISQLKDDFNDGVLDTGRWAQNYGDPTESGGRGRVPCTTGYAGLRSASIYGLAGSRMLARIYPPTPNGAASAGCSFLVLSDTGGTDAGFFVDPAQNAMGLYLRSGYADPGALFPTYDPVAHAWLRLRETGGTLYWEAAPNGATWTVLRTATSPAWVSRTDLSLLFEAHRDTGTADHAEIDNVNLPPAQQSAPLGTASETDTGQAAARSKSRTLTHGAETDTARPLGRTKTKTLPLASNTENAQPLARSKRRPLPLTQNTETGQPLGKTKRITVQPAIETDAGQSAGRTRTRALGTAVESEAARVVGRSRPLPPAAEQNTTRSLQPTKSAAVGAATESGTARPVGAAKRRTLAPAVETGTSSPLQARKARGLAAAHETGQALQFVAPGRLDSTTEADTAQPLSRGKRRTVLHSSATQAAQALARSKRLALSPATEASSARQFAMPGRLTAASETNTALTITRIKRHVLAPAMGEAQAQPLGRHKARAVGAVGETDNTLDLVATTPNGDVAVDIGAPYSPWAAGTPTGRPYSAQAPHETGWEVGAPC